MNSELDRLTILKATEGALKRQLDRDFYDDEKKKKAFKKLHECQQEIEKVKFKMRIERKLKNENSNTN